MGAVIEDGKIMVAIAAVAPVCDRRLSLLRQAVLAAERRYRKCSIRVRDGPGGAARAKTKDVKK